MTQASRQAFLNLAPKLPKRRRAVYGVVEGSIIGVTFKDVMAALRWPVNCVSGRLSELEESGLIKTKDERRDGMSVYVQGDGRPMRKKGKRARGTVVHRRFDPELQKTFLEIELDEQENSPFGGGRVRISW